MSDRVEYWQAKLDSLTEHIRRVEDQRDQAMRACAALRGGAHTLDDLLERSQDALYRVEAERDRLAALVVAHHELGVMERATIYGGTCPVCALHPNDTQED